MNKLLAKIKKPLCALLIASMMMLTACGKGEDAPIAEDGQGVFTFDGEDVPVGEVYLYFTTVKESYEASYGDAIWEMNIASEGDSKITMEDVTRKDIIEDIVRVKLLVKHAKEYGVELTEEEKGNLKLKADTFFENITDAQISKMDITVDIVYQVLVENEIADRVKDKLISDAGIEVSDEAARETTFYDLCFEKYRVASEGDVKEYNEDEKKAQYERALQAYDTLVNPVKSSENPMNIDGLAEYYGLSNAGYHTMSPGEIENTYGADIKNMLYKLDDGSYSLVTESDYGYHIFYMKSLTDRAMTDQNKKNIYRERVNNLMTEKVQVWLKDADSNFSYENSVDHDLYEKITFK